MIRGGARSRIGSRTGPGVNPAVAGAMARRRSLEGEARSSEGAIAADRAQLVEPDERLIAAASSTPEDAALLADLQLTTALIVPLRARAAPCSARSTWPSGPRAGATGGRRCTSPACWPAASRWHSTTRA